LILEYLYFLTANILKKPQSPLKKREAEHNREIQNNRPEPKQGEKELKNTKKTLKK